MNNYTFKYKLNDSDKLKIINFYNSFNFISINQFPDWETINNPHKTICYYIKTNDDKIIEYAIIVENKKVATINYGPISKNYKNNISAIENIKKFYKKKKFIKLVIKLGIIDDTAKIIQDTFKNEYKFFDNPFNWSTLRLHLENDIDVIYKQFSKNHKRSIKKAEKNNIKIKTIKTKKEILILSDIFDKMYNSRKLVKPFNDTQKVFVDIFNFFNKNKNGFILGVYKDNKILGGLILPTQGNTVYYQYGFSDVDYRHIPILHSCFFYAIKKSKELKYKYFDFGGYIPDINPKNQIYNINKFKYGFKGELIYYPKNMHFIFSPFKHFLFLLIKKVYFFYIRLFK